MMPGIVSKLSYSSLKSETIITPLTDIVNLTLGSTTSIQTIRPPFGGFAGKIILTQMNELLSPDIKLVRDGNIIGIGLAGYVIAFGGFYELLYLPDFNVWVPQIV